MSIEQKAKTLLEKIKKLDRKINSFIYLNPDVLAEAKALDGKKSKGKLYGKIIAVKSNINAKGLKINCSSKTLDDYYGSFDATVIEKIKKEDGLIIGMTNMDEFAAGSSGETSAFGPTENPAVRGYISGGSSSGSVAAVAAEFCDLALGSDTGGSIRLPASFCGVVGVKPSYGAVSRYGLIDLSMSLDQIGPIAKNVAEAELLFNVIKGKDEKDTMTLESAKTQTKNSGKIKIGILKVAGVEKKIQNFIDEKIKEIQKKLKWEAKEIKIENVELAVETYYPLVYAEFFSSTRRFDGRKYGKLIEESCGEEVLRRILGGSEITKAEFENAYYEKALQVKEMIKEEFENSFLKFDCIVLPTSPGFPWKIGEGKKMKPEEIYAYDALAIPANLAEACALSLPVGKISKFPIGIQIICGKGEEDKMFCIAKQIEELFR